MAEVYTGRACGLFRADGPAGIGTGGQAGKRLQIMITIIS
jgi:hypothetical protein